MRLEYTLYSPISNWVEFKIMQSRRSTVFQTVGLVLLVYLGWEK